MPAIHVWKRLVLVLALAALCSGCALPTPPGEAPATPVQQPGATALAATAVPVATGPTPSIAPGEVQPTAPSAATSAAGRPPSSKGLVERAQAEGRLDAETALVYQVYAAYGDGRLPAEYRGDDQLAEDSHFQLRLAGQYDRLSPQAQAALAPFLLPPSAPGSWVELQGETAGRLPGLAAATRAAVQWGTLPAAGGRIKVWYQKRYAGDDAKAAGVAKAIDARIWPSLTAFMPTPLADGGQKNNGGDASLDIYLVHIANRGEACAYQGLPSPAYILVDSRRPLGDDTHPGIVQTVAHELMHASQFTYHLAQDWTDWGHVVA